jgi:hypothetical protein
MTNKQVNDCLNGDVPGTARHTVKQQQIRIKALEKGLKYIIDQYITDGMEQMNPRDNAIYQTAIEVLKSPQPIAVKLPTNDKYQKLAEISNKIEADILKPASNTFLR